MVDLSHLFSLANFSLIDFIFGDNESKNQNNLKVESINIKKIKQIMAAKILILLIKYQLKKKNYY